MDFLKPPYRLLCAGVRQIVNYWKLRNPSSTLQLHIGCGKMRFDGFINIDVNISWAVDYVGHALKLPCRPNTVDRIEWYHVIEHLPLPLVEPTLKKFYEILKPGGIMVTECPHLDETIREYLAGNNERLFSIYGRQRFPGDAHHWGYTPESLTALLQKIGFVHIVSKKAQDGHAANEPCMRIECSKA